MPRDTPRIATAPPVAASGQTRRRPAAPRTRWQRLQTFVSPDNWQGSIKLGLRLDRGNTDQSDYQFALELDREMEGGWGLDSKVEYLFTETDGRTTRDNWLVEARGERQNVDGLGYYLGGSFEEDRLSGFDHSAFVTSGALYEPLDTEAMSWIVRGGAGARHRVAGEAEEDEAEFIVELGSIFDMAVTETSQFKSETTVLAGASSRADQRFALSTDLVQNWGMELGLRIKHEFEPVPEAQPTDTRVEVSVVRRF